VDALRADRRGRAAHHPLALPAAHPATPTAEDVAAFLVRQDGVADGLAAYAARASQGHIGRARALARDEATRNRRREVVTIPARLTSLGACMTAANLAR
jgi:DNA polymerase-3 subunit delta'